ncbi:hypothetical protein [Bacillus wiedmannii]|uniref:hypothetical protein n=1 Tax=Bacillus wiedmannii TaxID=1890302 RepID=UPI0020D1FBBF|nr:hypothetical protein [Bacillus wiedmannii]
MTSPLYELSMPGYEELKWYPIEVKRGKQTFQFEVYRSDNEISVFYIDELGRKRAVISTEELTLMLLVEEDKKRFRKFVGDSEWVLLDGVCADRGMEKEELAAYLYLKTQVLDEMEGEVIRKENRL